MRRVPLLLIVGAALACASAPAANSESFTVVPSAAAAPTPLTSARDARAERARFRRNDRARVARRTVAAFVPLYGRASHRFDVAWLLLASIHKQETAFSTASGTYHGLNFVHCCAGPMQFNVTNGPVSTWRQFRHAHTLAPRPDAYPHPTRRHPSVYDDYDAIMAAAQLLQANGATTVLDDGSAWRAAYLYYGPGDLGPGDFGITYADEVVARALNWQRRGFCPACRTPRGLVAAVHKAWAPAKHKKKHKHKSKHHKRRHKVQQRELRSGRRRSSTKRADGHRRAHARRPQKDAHVRPDQPGQQPSGGQPQPQGSPQGGSGADPGGQPGGVGPGDACVLPTGCPGAPVHGAAPSEGSGAAPAGGPAPADPGGSAQPGAAGAGTPAG
jgi:hypothetical protein